VHAVEGENHEMKYEILFPVAWDFIQYDERFEPLLAKSDALVFGSLVTRNAVSEKSLHSLVETAKYKVFDINLRAPHYSSSIIKNLLKETNLLKLNENELTEVAGWYSSTVKTTVDSINLLQDDFGIKEIIVTKGSNGSTYFSPDGTFSQKAYAVKVADTIGSGDSFLAGFLARKFQGKTANYALSTAAALASFVTSHHGACPDYSIAELEQFSLSHDIS
jgi:fructokinase